MQETFRSHVLAFWRGRLPKLLGARQLSGMLRQGGAAVDPQPPLGFPLSPKGPGTPLKTYLFRRFIFHPPLKNALLGSFRTKKANNVRVQKKKKTDQGTEKIATE